MRPVTLPPQPQLPVMQVGMEHVGLRASALEGHRMAQGAWERVCEKIIESCGNEGFPPPPLTEVELRILSRIADGAPIKEIASEENTTLHSVSKCLEQIRARFEVAKTVQVVATCIRNGWIE